MGDSAKVEEIIREIFDEGDSGARFAGETETDATLVNCGFLEKEKGKMVYLVDDEEVENIDVDHSTGRHEVLDSTDKTTRAYHEPMKTKKVNIGLYVEAKEAIIADYFFDFEVAKIIELLRDYKDLFLQGYHELKGMHESLGEMKIDAG
ncbi:hypothetical protein KI387_028287, partial [Taxus chinensis]